MTTITKIIRLPFCFVFFCFYLFLCNHIDTFRQFDAIHVEVYLLLFCFCLQTSNLCICVTMLLCKLVIDLLVFLLLCLWWSHSVSLLILIVFTQSAIFQCRQNVDPEIKAWTKDSSTRHNNRSSHCFRRQHRAHPLYDNTTPMPNITNTEVLHTDTSAANQATENP